MAHSESRCTPIPAENASCLDRIREARWPDGVRCPYCSSSFTIKKGTSRKETQRYQCQNCDRGFTDLTGTVFENHQLSVSEMCYIVTQTDSESITSIASDLDRSYKTVLNFVHDLRSAAGSDSPALSDLVG
ncbi:IS1/IS1595 family N-terminal zinc-binding domain-containing protein [Halodesulfurarchaeum formicicum]